MAAPRRQRSRQAELFPRSMRAVIAIAKNHRLVQMTDEIDWTELLELVALGEVGMAVLAPGRKVLLHPVHVRRLLGRKPPQVARLTTAFAPLAAARLGRTPGWSDDGGLDEFCEFLPSRAFGSTFSASTFANRAAIALSWSCSDTTNATSSSYVGGAEISPVRSSRRQSQEIA
jgi:hypothetical protein